MSYPKDFIFGVASAAPQIEGCGLDGGRGESIWDVFARRPGAVAGGVNPGTGACDSYRLFDVDLWNMMDLGVNGYRMSISWGRVMPEGTGRLNQQGLDYYKRCFEKLLKAGISPNVTLYHWDLPQALESRGGWVNRDSVYWFQEYAANMFRAFGDIVPTWVTINEPIATYVGYGEGFFAPGYRNKRWGNQARHNVMTASGAGVEAFRSSGAKGQIGVVIDIWKRIPLTDDERDVAMARDLDEENWKFYTDRLLGTGYSDYIIDKFAREGTLMDMTDEDFRLTRLPIDFYGMNYYNTVAVTASERRKLSGEKGGNISDDGRTSHPERIAPVLRMIIDMYKLKIPVYITENGLGHQGEESVDPADGMIHDDDRVAYLRQALDAVESLLADGVDVRGYYLWTLMDNFEWSAGHDFRYGIMHTDFETYRRTWKKSGLWYRDYIRRARGN